MFRLCLRQNLICVKVSFLSFFFFFFFFFFVFMVVFYVVVVVGGGGGDVFVCVYACVCLCVCRKRICHNTRMQIYHEHGPMCL